MEAIVLLCLDKIILVICVTRMLYTEGIRAEKIDFGHKFTVWVAGVYITAAATHAHVYTHQSIQALTKIRLCPPVVTRVILIRPGRFAAHFHHNEQKSSTKLTSGTADLVLLHFS